MVGVGVAYGDISSALSSFAANQQQQQQLNDTSRSVALSLSMPASLSLSVCLSVSYTVWNETWQSGLIVQQWKIATLVEKIEWLTGEGSKFFHWKMQDWCRSCLRKSLPWQHYQLILLKYSSRLVLFLSFSVWLSLESMLKHVVESYRWMHVVVHSLMVKFGQVIDSAKVCSLSPVASFYRILFRLLQLTSCITWFVRCFTVVQKYMAKDQRPSFAHADLTCYTLLSPSITFSLFHSELKTYLFRKSYPPP